MSRRTLPTISIIVPVLDGADHLEQTLRSVIDQDYQATELVVMDGGSTDGSLDIIRRLDSSLTFWTSAPDRGQADAIQRGFAHTSGAIVNWLDADDVLTAGALSALAEAVGEDAAESGIYVGHARTIDVDGRTTVSRPATRTIGRVLPEWPSVVGGVQASTFLTRSAWLELGGVDPELHFMMDVDLYLRAADLDIPFFVVEDELATYRHHRDAKTVRYWKRSHGERRRLYRNRLRALPRHQRSAHRTRVADALTAGVLGPVNGETPSRERWQRIGTALRDRPDLALRPREIRRLFRLALGGSASSDA